MESLNWVELAVSCPSLLRLNFMFFVCCQSDGDTMLARNDENSELGLRMRVYCEGSQRYTASSALSKLPVL